MSSDPSADSAREYWDHVESVFAAVVAAEGSARTAVLDAYCAARHELRAEVEALLAAHARAGDFIVPATHTAWGVAAADEGARARGMRVGAFSLVDRIAHGGMGDVYSAERADGEYAQRVAIKFIAARLRGVETHRRFRAERQILASLQHPNIVTLLDGGVSADGQPFIVMEYIDGLPITEFCRRQASSLEARLRLFQELCAAVGFAHRNLVIHRDLKPGNVFVTADGVVKVLDFGVATLLEAHSGAASTTASLLGPLTPNYASPEQVRGQRATTACDVYALGVMLYELLSGTRPYETGGKTLDEVLAIVLERDPIRPSTACIDDLPYDRRRLRGDLDWIVLKAMAKNPDRRYASAEALADDLHRATTGQAVLAREPSLAYLAKKTIARHRTVFAVAGLSLILLIVALVGALWQADVAARERERATRRFNDVRELAGSLIFKIHDEVAPLAGSTPVRQTVVAEGLRFLERLEQDAAGDPGLQLELSRAYRRIGTVQGALGSANLGNIAGARTSFVKARDLAAGLSATRGGSWEAVEALVEANLALSGVLERPAAIEASRAALAAATAWHGREPFSVRSRTLLARSHYAVSIGDKSTYVSHMTEANRLFASVLAENPDDTNQLRNVALTEKMLGGYYDDEHQYDRGREHHRRALALDERRLKASPEDRRAQIDVAIDIGNIAFGFLAKGEYPAAIAEYHRSLEIRERLAASDPSDAYARGRVGYAHEKLAVAYLGAGQLTLAETHAKTALATVEALAGTNNVALTQIGDTQRLMGDVEAAAGRRQSACTWHANAMRTFRRYDEPHPPAFVTSTIEWLERALTTCKSR